MTARSLRWAVSLRVRAPGEPGRLGRDDPVVAEGETDGNGRWRREAVPEGDCSLQVVPRGANNEEGTSCQELHVDSGLETPVAGAAVVLRWQRHQYRLAVSADDGSFAFPLDDIAGSATVLAKHLGFADNREVGLEVVPDAAPQPVVRTLEGRDDVLAARRRTGGRWARSRCLGGSV